MGYEAIQGSIDVIARYMPRSNQDIAEKNIEKLLTHCKIYLELFGLEEARDVAEFIASAEKSIAARVDFVSDQTDLSAHQAILRKIARRGARKPRARVFTTNYDLGFEYAAKHNERLSVEPQMGLAPEPHPIGRIQLLASVDQKKKRLIRGLAISSNGTAVLA
ncbi:hypothetical protein J4G43_040740 [Bradyrhizobium barranii subsp. barranii]|uniref:SIR2-like protein n=1 Tax=Bradyrhizobium barranii subsp. barranii TaxID=2823807 RepID=A0A939S527_9BRAD|nr:hypothetical protein [Bradyrhizobium barranii]UEM10884.1 hypothetical protein J4G43_040740 [Bradyrhizobium barranii subsp. barranii]